ncbi:4'-phosphopantetheinyl transferase superfamily protein [Streptomyces sp. SS7]|uniref:4'-phosphopantetheinyl transferase family protein n=1 Tax=Streptomyces sp. SS7 TaxID=3108485 RepID=UPI0030EEEA0D
MTPLMRRLLPDTVEVTEVRGELTGPPLFPEEAAVVARAVDKRRREFATGRRCARLSLAALGLPAVPLLSGPQGEPRWPAGVVGAVSHCDGYRVAAVARATDLAALGVDAETAAPLPDGVLEAVSLPEERADLARLARTAPQVPWDRLLFSAKESVYKVWFPLARRPLGFEEARLRFTREPDLTGAARGTFDVTLLVPVPREFAGPVGGAGLTGRWLVDDGLVLTALAPVVRRPAEGPGEAPGGVPASCEPMGRAVSGAPRTRPSAPA